MLFVFIDKSGKKSKLVASDMKSVYKAQGSEVGFKVN
jgi:hypothetical protein